jgi:hypothetical protein
MFAFIASLEKAFSALSLATRVLGAFLIDATIPSVK